MELLKIISYKGSFHLYKMELWARSYDIFFPKNSICSCIIMAKANEKARVIWQLVVLLGNVEEISKGLRLGTLCQSGRMVIG